MPSAADSFRMYFFQSRCQSLRNLLRCIVSPKVHHEHTRRFVQHVIMQSGGNDAMLMQSFHHQFNFACDENKIASEIKLVMKALHEHGIIATALHNHMLNESPRMFMMHFWGYDTPEKIAQGLAAALKEVHT